MIRGPVRPWAFPLAIAVHFGLSVLIEHGMARIMKYALSLRMMLMTHTISYGSLIMCVFLYRLGQKPLQ